MATFGGPNLQIDGAILYLDSANSKSYTNNQSIWRDLSISRNQMTLNNIIFDPSDLSLTLSNINSKLNTTIPINNSSNITLSFIAKLKGTLNEIQTLTKKSISVSGLNQNISKFNIFHKTFARNSNDITEKTYLNGQLLDETTYSDPNFLNSNNLKIQINTNGKIGSAKIESFIIYNRSLSSNEILQNYNALKSRFNL